MPKTSATPDRDAASCQILRMLEAAKPKTHTLELHKETPVIATAIDALISKSPIKTLLLGVFKIEDWTFVEARDFSAHTLFVQYNIFAYGKGCTPIILRALAVRIKVNAVRVLNMLFTRGTQELHKEHDRYVHLVSHRRNPLSLVLPCHITLVHVSRAWVSRNLTPYNFKCSVECRMGSDILCNTPEKLASWHYLGNPMGL